MATVRKYEFDVSFDHRFVPVTSEPELESVVLDPEPEPPPPVFSLEELEAARSAAWSEGRSAGEDEMRASLQHQIARTGEVIAATLSDCVAQQKRVVAEIERQAGEIIVALMRKLFPVLLERSGTDDIEALIRDSIAQALDQPRIVVRCGASVAEHIDTLVRNAAARAGFDGRISVLPDPMLTGQDCRVDWAEGGVERTPHRMMEKIETAIARCMEAFDRMALGGDQPVYTVEETVS